MTGMRTADGACDVMSRANTTGCRRTGNPNQIRAQVTATIASAVLQPRSRVVLRRVVSGYLVSLRYYSTIFQKESFRLILPAANSSKSTPRTSIRFPEIIVPVIVHSETPKSPQAQCLSSP